MLILLLMKQTMSHRLEVLTLEKADFKAEPSQLFIRRDKDLELITVPMLREWRLTFQLTTLSMQAILRRETLHLRRILKVSMVAVLVIRADRKLQLSQSLRLRDSMSRSTSEGKARRKTRPCLLIVELLLQSQKVLWEVLLLSQRLVVELSLVTSRRES